MKTMKKTIALLVAVSMIVGCVIGATLAWLTSTAAPVVNTFTTSDIEVKLEETTGKDYKMIPGYTIAKNPKVTVEKGSEDCWLFVKIEEENRNVNADYNYFDYEIASGWNKLEGVEGIVYYQQVTGITENKTFSVLKDDQVTISDNVTKTDMESAKTKKPTLTFTAYASQLYKSNVGSDAERTFTPADAWANAQPTTP